MPADRISLKERRTNEEVIYAVNDWVEQQYK